MEFNGMTPEALAAWERLTNEYGQPLNVLSAYRDPDRNAAVGGAKGSQHLHGNAFDVDVANLSEAERIALIQQARAAGFQGVGVYENSLHFDVGPERAWGPSYSRDSLPAWANAGLNGTATMPQPEQPQMNALAMYQQQEPEPPQMPRVPYWDAAPFMNKRRFT